MDLAIILLRVVFALAVLAALILPRVEAVAPPWRSLATWLAIVTAVGLLALRVTIRAREPGKLPSSTG